MADHLYVKQIECSKMERVNFDSAWLIACESELRRLLRELQMENARLKLDVAYWKRQQELARAMCSTKIQDAPDAS